jgi:hypothetical protein
MSNKTISELKEVINSKSHVKPVTLADIQAAVKAPKGNFNSFGKYKYRSAEDIVEAVKPVINPLGFWLVLTDEIVEVGGRIYVKATATLSNGSLHYATQAFAREEEVKKGMDGSQVTGAASSYARKYALNGLFAIDDTKDADATNEHRDEVGNDRRDYLLNLLETSSYEEKQRVKMRIKINAITSIDDFEKAKTVLIDSQVGIDSAVNIQDTELNKHLAKITKQPA